LWKSCHDPLLVKYLDAWMPNFGQGLADWIGSFMCQALILPTHNQDKIGRKTLLHVIDFINVKQNHFYFNVSSLGPSFRSLKVSGQCLAKQQDKEQFLNHSYSQFGSTLRLNHQVSDQHFTVVRDRKQMLETGPGFYSCSL
jgi:hypothetical protein